MYKLSTFMHSGYIPKRRIYRPVRRRAVRGAYGKVTQAAPSDAFSIRHPRGCLKSRLLFRQPNPALRWYGTVSLTVIWKQAMRRLSLLPALQMRTLLSADLKRVTIPSFRATASKTRARFVLRTSRWERRQWAESVKCTRLTSGTNRVSVSKRN